jgi:hypothetical protein
MRPLCKGDMIMADPGKVSKFAREKLAHNKYTVPEIETAIREKIRTDNIRADTTFKQRMRWEIWLSDMTTAEKLFALAIWEHADEGGTNAFPSLDRLRVMVGGSRRTLVESQKKFNSWLFGAVIKGAGRRPNEYRFQIPAQTLSELNGAVVVPHRYDNGTRSSTIVGTAKNGVAVPHGNHNGLPVPQGYGHNGTRSSTNDGTGKIRSSTISVRSSTTVVPDSIDLKEERKNAAANAALASELEAGELLPSSQLTQAEPGGQVPDNSAPLYKNSDIVYNIASGEIKNELFELTNEPPKRKNRGGRKAAGGTRLPEDWVLPEDWAQDSLTTLGLTRRQVDFEAMKFRGWWLSPDAKNPAKKDWRATWRNWMLTAAGRGINVPPGWRAPEHGPVVPDVPRVDGGCNFDHAVECAIDSLRAGEVTAEGREWCDWKTLDDISPRARAFAEKVLAGQQTPAAASRRA